MNREPSTAIRIPKRQHSAFPKKPGSNPELWRGIFNAARDAFGPALFELVHVSENRAFFQAHGNKPVYSILLTDAELAYFHPAVKA